MEKGSDPRQEDFVYVGSFEPREARRVLMLLEGEKIDFKIEVDDSPLKEMNPAQAGSGGAFGGGSLVKIHLQPDRIDDFNIILQSLYPV